MLISNYNPLKIRQFEYRWRIFLVVLWASIILVVAKFIESIFFTHLPFLEILRDLAYGFAILGLQVLVLEKGKTMK